MSLSDDDILAQLTEIFRDVFDDQALVPEMDSGAVAVTPVTVPAFVASTDGSHCKVAELYFKTCPLVGAVAEIATPLIEFAMTPVNWLPSTAGILPKVSNCKIWG